MPILTDAELVERARTIIVDCSAARLVLATAESCTGGLIAATLTEIAGSSAVVDRGFVTYSNEAKMELLGVPAGMLQTHGAVSREVALAMARGALLRSRAEIAVAVTGVAGPGGGSEAKPVGLVHLAVARTGFDGLHEERRFGDIGRHGVRAETVGAAFSLIEQAMALGRRASE